MTFLRDLASQVRSQLTLPALVATVVQSLVLSALMNLALRVFNVVPANEYLYWAVVPLLFLSLITTGRTVFSSALSRPVIGARIELIMPQKAQDEKGGVGICIQARISNAGLPTALDDWRVAVVPAGGSPVYGEGQRIPATFAVGDPGAGRRYTDADALYAKTARPVETGAFVRGILWCRFQGVAAHIFHQPSTKVVLEARDVFGTVHRVEQQIPAEAMPKPGYHPGIGGEPL